MGTAEKRPDTIIVVGLGQSAQDAWRELRNFHTVGVNDVAKFHQPDELLILDRKGRFTERRMTYISCTQANHIWSPYEEWDQVVDAPWRKIHTRKYTKEEPWDWTSETIPTFLTSPFAAIGLAYHLGATRIGIVGMDLLGDHHMGKHADRINHQLRRLWQDMIERGTRLWNCSPIANITALPYIDLTEMNNAKL